MRYRIEAPGQPVAYGDYRDEIEARSIVRRSGLVQDMSAVKVTPAYSEVLTAAQGKLRRKRRRAFSYQPHSLPPTWSPEWDSTPESYDLQVQLRRELIAGGNPGMSERDVKIAEVIARYAGDMGLSDVKIVRLVTMLSTVLDEPERELT